MTRPTFMRRIAQATVAAQILFVVGYLATVFLLVVTGAASGSPVQGLAQRVAATVIPLGVASVAWLVFEQERPVTRVADLVRGK